MSRTAMPALPRWSMSLAAVAIRYSRRFWPLPSSRNTAGFLGDIAPECSDDRGHGERGRVAGQQEPAAPLWEEVARPDHGRPAQRLAGVEGQPARQPGTEQLPHDAFDQG